MEDSPNFFLCECQHEVLVAQKDDDEIFLSMHYFGYRTKLGLWDRIKYAFKYIRKGKLHEDQIILSNKNAHLLADFLKKI